MEDIGGSGIIDGSHVTLAFANGRVSGRAGCNGYFAGYELTGESLRFQQAGATMMACAPALMDQERKFLDALASVTDFDFSNDGALLLKAGNETVLKARH
ncbi:lipoprotein [Haematobacter missouriensis]|nr:lipoprotein [Haematobacter missouriensis]